MRALHVFLAFVLALLTIGPASAQGVSRITATWDPQTVTAATLAGICPTAKDAEAACPLERGVTYRATVAFQVDQDVDQLLIDTEPGGLDVTATSAATQSDFTPALSAGQSSAIDIEVRIPEVNPRRERSFYLGKLLLRSGDGPVQGSLLISLVASKATVRWQRATVGGRPGGTCVEKNVTPGDRAPLETEIGSGCTLTRNLGFSANLDIADFAIRTNTDRISLNGVPRTVEGGKDNQVGLIFNAPIVTRKTRQDVVLQPASGLSALSSALRMRITILPAEVKWSPPELRGTLNVTTQKPIERTVTLVSNVDIPGVRFKTADLGLTPIVWIGTDRRDPTRTLDLKAGEPQPIQIRLCPGYAATTYFVGITPYIGNQPLSKRLTIKMQVEGTELPPPGTDACAG